MTHEQLRANLEQWAKAGRHFKQPGAWLREAFVLAKGIDCTPQPLPEGIRKGYPKRCFRNARALVARRWSLIYCEGYVQSDELPIPVHHAWAIDAMFRVIDPTLENPETFAYVGIPVERTLLRRFSQRNSEALLVDDFERVHTPLIYHLCPELEAEVKAQVAA